MDLLPPPPRTPEGESRGADAHERRVRFDHRAPEAQACSDREVPQPRGRRDRGIGGGQRVVGGVEEEGAGGGAEGQCHERRGVPHGRREGEGQRGGGEGRQPQRQAPDGRQPGGQCGPHQRRVHELQVLEHEPHDMSQAGVCEPLQEPEGTWHLAPKSGAPTEACGLLPTAATGLSLPGGGGRYSPLARTPLPKKKGSIDGPQNPTETDPRAPEVTQTRNSAKNENGIIGISALRGFKKVIICHVFGGKKIDHFQCSKEFSAPSVPEFITTD